MRLSQHFTRSAKEAPKGEVSRNAQLLIRAGYVARLMAGVYSFLPLGLRTLHKIENIVREEMGALGAEEVLMPSLNPRENWEKTGRWDGLDVLFKLASTTETPENLDLALGATHEEVVTPLVAAFVQSYRDLPVAVFQIQTKFRNEPRAKSGLLRGREFRMKDLYSFHATPEDLDSFYERATAAYQRMYQRLGIGDRTLLTYSGGGTFSKYSHEFQTLTSYGEDTIYRLPGTQIAINKEIIDDADALAGIIPNYQPGDEAKLEEVRGIEVGNIFKLGTRYSDAFDVTFAGADTPKQKMVMGCYGLGTTRVMGAIVECLCDDKGLVWPENIAPYKVGLLNLKQGDKTTDPLCEKLYAEMNKAGIEVIYDDRDDTAGSKFANMDLLGLPWQVLIGPRNAEKGVCELKNRASGQVLECTAEEVIKRLK